jgi:hypothetical protein
MARLKYAHDISLELYPYVDMPEEAGRKSLTRLLTLMQDAVLLSALSNQSLEADKKGD